MRSWLESLGVLLLAGGGMALGAWFSRRRKPWWLIGYLVPLFVIVVYGLASHIPKLSFIPPISWMMLGRTKFALAGLIGGMMLTTLLLRLPKRRDRIALGLLIVCVVSAFSVWPFLAPAFNQNHLASLETHMDRDGVCLQNTSYTCGPASAVTALRKLGFPADEGKIAILAHTCQSIGTPPDILAETLRSHYGSQGLICDYRVFSNLDELRNAGLTLAVIKYNFLVDHYVTVLDVNESIVTVGDPLSGLMDISRDEFAKKWRFQGVTLKRQ